MDVALDTGEAVTKAMTDTKAVATFRVVDGQGNSYGNKGDHGQGSTKGANALTTYGGPAQASYYQGNRGGNNNCYMHSH